MRKLGQQDKTDSLTKLWTEDAARELIEKCQRAYRESEGDALHLIRIDGWEEYNQELKNNVIQQAAFDLKCQSGRIDVTARVGESIFLLYEVGCRSLKEAKTKAGYIRDVIGGIDFFKAHKEVRVVVGTVWCRGLISDYGRLLNGARYAANLALQSEKPVIVIDENTIEEIGTVTADQAESITEDKSVTLADIEFITELTDTLFLCQDVSVGIEKSLERLCAYFQTERAGVVELASDRRHFEVTYVHEAMLSRVANDNLKYIPQFLADYYRGTFDKEGLCVYNSITELQKVSAIMAEREKIYGTKALMQCAILEEGRFTGFISICDFKKERLWSRREIDTFLIAGKIITASILHMRSLKYSRRIEYSDLLTEAWNLNRFLLETQECSPKNGLKKAILIFDLKNFKEINREFGYNLGNEVLIEITNIIRQFVEKDECYARIEADMFVLLLYYPEQVQLESRVRQLLHYIEHLSAKLGLKYQFVCMVGICTEEEVQADIREMIECADMVRKSIKDYHKSTYQFFDAKAQRRRDREKYITTRAVKALNDNEFLVYYQPQVNVSDGEYVGLEALVRWKPDEGPMIMPGEFIPLFERNGFITELDLYVFEQVCRDIAGWRKAGKKLYPVSVNLSRIHIKDQQFLQPLQDIRHRYDVPVDMISLEVTESAFLSSPEVILDAAVQIKEKGFLLSMDDFGTGFSSLSMLKDIPVDIIKLDKTFFQSRMSRREKIIISNVIHMAKELEIEVISEGIETKEQEQFLREIGCDMAQGYLYAKPEPLEVHEDKLWKQMK